VRYFGGTKLGTGGLVRAYSDAANLVIEHSNIITYEKNEVYNISMQYSDTNRVDYLLEQNNITISAKDFLSSEVHYKITGTQENLKILFDQTKRLIHFL
jgi:putative IMPACT (imprinted ancient) family translation regulator